MTTHRPGLMLALFLALGITIGGYVPYFCWVAFMLIVVALIFRHWPIAVIALGIVLIALHMQIPTKPRGVITAIIVSDVKEIQWANGVKKEFNIQFSGKKAKAQYFGDQSLHFGDEVSFSGKWFRGPAKYQRYNDIHEVFWKVSIAKRDHFIIHRHHQANIIRTLGFTVNALLKNELNKYLISDARSTIVAMVLGERGDMPKDIKDLFIRSGAAHILAISGMNMTVVAAMFLFLMKLVGIKRRWQMIITIMILWLYALASGLSASVLRACVMATVVLGGFACDEEGDPLNSLGLAACILLVINPGNLFDIGFQLSFAAVTGILLMSTWFTERLTCMPKWLAQSLAISIAAGIATAPILLYHFNTFTPISIISNIFIVPLADIIFLLGLSLSLSGIIFPLVTTSLATCINTLFNLLVWLAYIFSQIPGGHWQF